MGQPLRAISRRLSAAKRLQATKTPRRRLVTAPTRPNRVRISPNEKWTLLKSWRATLSDKKKIEKDDGARPYDAQFKLIRVVCHCVRVGSGGTFTRSRLLFYYFGLSTRRSLDINNIPRLHSPLWISFQAITAGQHPKKSPYHPPLPPPHSPINVTNIMIITI